VTVRPPASLRRRLTRRLLAFQAAVLLLVTAVLAASGSLFDLSSADATIERLRGAVIRDAAGGLALDQGRLAPLRADVPDLWFVIRDRSGRQLSEGAVPAAFAGLGGALDTVGQARLGWTIDDPPGPTGRMRWVGSPAGEIQVLTGSEGPLSLSLIGLSVGLVLLKTVLPILAVMALGTLVATPLVVRGALAGLDRAAAQAQRIDIDQRGARLPVKGLTREVEPLVTAVNGALARLDDGYERQQRFLADAAHELRTPIAILSTRVAALPSGPDRTRLREDVARLATLAEQLLDLQRLDRQAPLEPVDLAEVTRQVLGDLAPLAFAAGYQMAFEEDPGPAVVTGDRRALERALTNLVQNAIDHGGRRGIITVRAAPGRIEVRDQGVGIPESQRDRVFEAFHRLQPQGRGTGLGLDLVQAIMRRHGGRVEVGDAPGGGARFGLVFPLPTAI
jgi:signal transduction histidine kinase